MRQSVPYVWPNDARIAVVFNIMYEGWSEGVAPGIGPMGNPLQQPGVLDTQAIAWADYGGQTGIWRLLDILNAHRISATVFASGVMAERYPETLQAALAAGHEIAAHSYAQDIIPAYLPEEEERRNIERSVAAIEQACGVRARGWVSPRGTPSPHTARLLAVYGLRWFKDAFDRDLPYRLQGMPTPFVAIPLTMEVNDMPLLVRYGNPHHAYLETFCELFERLYHHEAPPTFMDVTVHAHVMGRPLGGKVLDEVIQVCQKYADVWFPTNSQVAEVVLSALA